MGDIVITVHNYIPKLMDADDATYIERLTQISRSLSLNRPEPFDMFVTSSIQHAAMALVKDSQRNVLLRQLNQLDLAQIGEDALSRLRELLPTPIAHLQLHILPAMASSAGGVSMAPGHILVCLRSDAWSTERLQRNVAHEYSHGVRQSQKPQLTEFGFGEAVPYTVRDFLVFEGLAMILADTLYPAPISPEPVSLGDEQEWWTKIDLDACGFEAYARYFGVQACEIGARIVRSYIRTHHRTVIAAHDATDHELYWNSCYPYRK